MTHRSKHESICEALKAAGYQEITVTPERSLFRCKNRQGYSELEFARAYFDDIPAETLSTQMQEKIIPSLKQNPGKRLHVTARFIAVITFRTPSGMAKGRLNARKLPSVDISKESDD